MLEESREEVRDQGGRWIARDGGMVGPGKVGTLKLKVFKNEVASFGAVWIGRETTF